MTATDTVLVECVVEQYGWKAVQVSAAGHVAWVPHSQLVAPALQPRGFGKPRFAGVHVKEHVAITLPRWLAEKEQLLP